MKNFNSSIFFDFKLAKYDLIGTIAHIQMLHKIGIFNDSELEISINACDALLKNIENDNLVIDFSFEDIHFFIQNELEKQIGNLARKIHTGRSRNDQVALDMRLYCLDNVKKIKDLIQNLINIMHEIAQKNKETLMPAYTHLQQAQPTSLCHYFYCYIEMLEEDIERIDSFITRTSKNPLGASSVCGSSLSLDRNFTTKVMNLEKLLKNSMNAISNRDFIIDFCSITSIVMTHLSRFCEDVIIYSSKEFDFFILDDAFCTGSSLMPNKKNPDLPELIRGKTGRIFGNLVSILSIIKNLPMAYNKDMQEDKKSLFENTEITIECLDILSDFVKSLRFNTFKMREQVINSYCLATDLVDYLILKNTFFKDAHDIISKLTKYCIDNKKWFYQLTIEEFKIFSNVFDVDVFEILKEENILKNHNTIGSPGYYLNEN